MKKQNMSIQNYSNQQGFTLVEFMVASVLGLVVIAGAGALYSYTKRLNDIGMARVATLQDLRAAATMIAQDSRSAGVFGCASLGRQNAPDVVNGEIALDAPNTLTGAKALTTLNDVTNPSAGVRWISQTTATGSTPLGIWDSAVFTPTSGVLLFYYGEGSLAYKSEAGNVVTFNAKEGHPNKIVESILASGNGYVVASGCNALQVQQITAVQTANEHPVTMNVTPPAPANAANLPAGVSKMGQYADMILQRYKVVAYVVGNIPNVDDPTSSSLYRFEFGSDGDNWSPPQQLAKNVTAMTAEYLFVRECPSGTIVTAGASVPAGSGATLATVNDQLYVVRDAEAGTGDVEQDTRGNQGPSSVRLTLTYNFPDVRGGSVSSGNKGEQFVITSTIRGGNVCASRKLMAL